MIALPWSRRDAAATIRPRKRRRLWRFVLRHLPSLILYTFLAAFTVIVLWPYMVVTVPSGNVGVVWKRFGHGTVIDPTKLRGEGLQVILPWDRIFLYNLRIQSVTQTYNAISADGVGLTATVNIRFRLRREFIPQIHQSIGPDYLALLGPEVASRLREVIARYTAEQVYSTDRQAIQEEIKNRVIDKLAERFLERDTGEPYRVPIRDIGVLYDTLLHEIGLPPDVVAAINRKAEQYYLAQEYVYRVDRERKESERKRVEAEGISAFQQIVSQGISDSYLRWRGIEATLELAKSNNAKIIIIGGGKDQLPVILGNVDAPKEQPRASIVSPPTHDTPSPAPPDTSPSEDKGRAADAPADRSFLGLPSLDSVLSRLRAPPAANASPPAAPGRSP
jgi:regulator of protease activity HflC (stomatin/prohibitin superfamily)